MSSSPMPPLATELLETLCPVRDPLLIERYRQALTTLTPRERELIVARIEIQWSLAEIAQRFGMRTLDGARMAVTRAVKRLTQNLGKPGL